MSSRRELANAIRVLSMDAVQAATCGHPGMPMGMADIAEVLWNDYLSHNPANPHWFDRDRFVLSNGHGSMLHYSLLHLSGYDLSIDELRNFRQHHSKTPGHPEVGETPGIETTTGPLGQGLANAVGMAIAEQVLADQFNRGKHTVIDHRTYVFAGDGCLMEGISHEVCSLAGTLGLGKLVAFYDDNGISIDGEVQGWFTDNTVERFKAYGWHVVPDVDGHDPQAVAAAIEAAHAAADRPSLICCKTVIGWGAPNMQGTAATHGAALGEKEVAATRRALAWEHPPFVIPNAVYDGWDAAKQGSAREAAWQKKFAAYARDEPELAAELERRIDGRLPDNWAEHATRVVKQTADRAENLASRKASQNALNAFGSILPELLGGSADLTGSNNTNQSESKALSRENRSGNYIYYGVREFGMSAIMNGIALHGGVRPYGGTFLVFSEYARNALRMAALMSIGNIFVYTHDSIGLGEDGPTHQAVEQTATLRLIPNMSVWRPCDAVESAVAWKAALERRDGPTCLLFTRQTVPHQPRSDMQLASIERGGYVLMESDGAAQAVLIGTGSEIGLAVDAAKQLAQQGCAVRVVSMPSTDRFDAQDSAYRDAVLPPGVPRVAVEAGVSDGWYKYVGTEGRVVGIDRFGASAPARVLFEHFGFTADNVAKVVSSAITASSAPAA